MPRLVADQIPWHWSAALVCVGQSEQPRRLEWELRSGAVLTPARGRIITLLTQDKTSEGDRTGSYCHPCFLRFKRRGVTPAADITSERITILEHPPQGQVQVKTGAPTRLGATAFHFEWIASGLTAVSFWTAPPSVGLAALEDRVRFDSGWTLLGPTESE
jgi:hypothetical protein